MTTLSIHLPTDRELSAFRQQCEELGVVMSDNQPGTGEEPLEMRTWRARRALQPGTPDDVVERASDVRKAITGKSDDADLKARVDSAKRALGVSK